MIANIQPVPNSPWLLVTHIATSDVYTPVNENFGRTVIVTGTIIFYLGLGAVLIWRQRRLRYFQSEAEAAEVLRKTEEELLLLTGELDNKVRERTAELQDVNQQLHALSQQMVDMQEQQIKNLARELHDRIGQNLTAININLSLVNQLLPKNSSEKIRARLTDTTHLVEETVARMRNVVAEFLPPMLESYGLSPALSWYGEQFAARTNIRVQVNDHRSEAARLSPEVEIGLFRIVQEAMNNIAKHSQASRVNIEMKDDDGLLMTISDDGVGFDLQVVLSRPAHWGFAIMQERARALRALLEIKSAPGEGAQIILRIPK
jgi:signal transduction histidine kinase